jgi:hypothetical protein
MHNISNLFYFGTTLYMFRTVSPSIIGSLRLYKQHHLYVLQVLWLLASIVIYLYSKTHQMHNISNLFYFGTTLYMFRTVSPSIIGSLRLYKQHQIYVIQVLWLLASIVIYLYSTSKINQMQNILNLFYFETTLCGCLLVSSNRTCMTYT